jgi:Mat/Ecp fimbriae major subunit
MLTNAKGRALAVASAIVALGLGAHQALAGNVTAHASATILQQIVVTENTQMNFATIAPPPAGGNVVLSTSGTITPAAGFVFLGAPAAGAFTATGAASQPAVVTFSTGDTLTGPGTAMPLGTYTQNAPATFNAAGNLTFNVGATLTVNANQTAGAYSGTYTVTVNY